MPAWANKEVEKRIKNNSMRIVKAFFKLLPGWLLINTGSKITTFNLRGQGGMLINQPDSILRSDFEFV